MFEQFVLDAIEMASARDLTNEEFTQAVNEQVRLKAGINPDELWEDQLSIH
jgi:hypothetical protein